MNDELRNAINAEAKRIGADPLDFATAMSYETGGTFDPWKKGPTTQWGQHIGFIQMGGPQRKQFGYSPDKSITQLVASSADYLVANGFKPGMSGMDLYSTINAGAPGRYSASDANNGGAPGDVRDKWENQMAGHRRNAAALLGGTYQAITSSAPNGSADIGIPSVEVSDWRTNTPRAPEVETAETGWWQLQSDAYNTQQTLPWLAVQNKQIAPDPNWSLDPKRVKQDLELRGVPESEVERYTAQLASVSEADYQDNLGRVKDDWDRNVRLSNAGLSGTALSMANSFLDPVALGADLMAATVAPALVIGNRGRRLGRVLEGAMAGAAGGAASVALNAAVNPNVNQSDLLAATVFGFGVGGAVGHLIGRPETTFEGAQVQRAGRRAVEAHEGVNMAGSVGAAKASPNAPFLNEDGLGLLDKRDFDPTFAGSIRPDLSARLQQDPNVLVNAGAGLVQDGTGKANGAVNAIAASEDQVRLFDEKRIIEAQTYNPQLADYAKRQKNMNKDQIERQFNDEVHSYITDRAPGRADRYDPAVVKVGNKQAELYADALKLQQNPFMREGIEDARPVLGADSIPTDPHYAPRYWNSNAIIAAVNEFGIAPIENLIGRAMKSANTALADDVIDRTSKAFTKAIVDRAHGLEDVSSHILSSDQLDNLVEMLEGHYGLAPEDAKALKYEFGKTHAKDAGRDGRNKARLLLDEKMSLENVANKQGVVDERGLSISDLVVTDARQNFTRYMRNAMGRVALARYRFKDPQTGELLINGFTSDREFAQYITKVKQKNADLISEGKITKAQAAAGIERLEYAYASILGRPTSAMEATNAGWFLRMVRKYNFSRIMNQVGFAQISEIGAPIASLGWKAALTQAPALRRVVTDDGASLLKSGLGDDLEAIMGVGADRLLNTSDYRIDEFSGGLHADQTSSWKEFVEGKLNKANRITSEISGLTQANVMLERWTAKAIVQKFSDMAANGGKGMSAARLADLGLDKAMTKRIMDMFNTEGNFAHETGFITGRKVTRAHFDKWADTEAREAFISAAHRLSRQIIQKNDIGNMTKWMSHPLAKALMQFRTFMVGSYGKQTLKVARMVHDRDYLAASHHLVMTTAFAAAGYILQMKAQAMLRSDGEEFLEERLSPKNLSAAAFSRAGASSIIPMLVDTGLGLGGQDTLFSYTRSTGQASNMLFGNPTTGGIDDLYQAGRSLAGIAREGEWSQEEARKVARVMMFGNSLPIVMGLNGWISGLPERAPR
ncbi:putative internal virion protein [Mesorhizobium phage vB_MloP_Lo5R7ANS]|uniref:Putative internal virion protein n=1 Tax=Mesorhizobium phage vB_MloP_Lo5R7ANS TaxID=1527771 RepID=A0A076YQK7_9CAUD|nr:putative internal virion protein [Mesorhizobium phage vB_MloP_Lo5R7ANS]AIK68526.1 putative internal virion protein [Mesorhizobium phage vB_MloP_Lo5R7ANS]